MSGRRSVAKGATGEREWAAFLVEHGIPASRQGYLQRVQVRVPDVSADGPLRHVAWEIKRVERGFTPVYAALDQAACSRFAATPAVAFRMNHREWIVSLRAEDFLDLLRGEA